MLFRKHDLLLLELLLVVGHDWVVFLSCILLNVEELYVLSDWGLKPLKLESLELVT